MQCVAPFELYHIILIHCVHYYLDTPVPPQIPPIHQMEYGPKPFSELGEHNDFHLQKRRLSCILSIATYQLKINDWNLCKEERSRSRRERGHTADRRTVGVSTLDLFCPWPSSHCSTRQLSFLYSKTFRSLKRIRGGTGDEDEKKMEGEDLRPRPHE